MIFLDDSCRAISDKELDSSGWWGSEQDGPHQGGSDIPRLNCSALTNLHVFSNRDLWDEKAIKLSRFSASFAPASSRFPDEALNRIPSRPLRPPRSLRTARPASAHLLEKVFSALEVHGWVVWRSPRFPWLCRFGCPANSSGNFHVAKA